MRFEGKLNIDLNEITSNLVPFPQMHFLVPSLSPVQTLHKVLDVRNTNQLFNDLTAKDNFLIDFDLNSHTQLAMALMIRGDLSLSEAQFYSEKIKKRVQALIPDEAGLLELARLQVRHMREESDIAGRLTSAIPF